VLQALERVARFGAAAAGVSFHRSITDPSTCSTLRREHCTASAALYAGTGAASEWPPAHFQPTGPIAAQAQRSAQRDANVLQPVVWSRCVRHEADNIVCAQVLEVAGGDVLQPDRTIRIQGRQPRVVVLVRPARMQADG
jgi:hypothetical protein